MKNTSCGDLIIFLRVDIVWIAEKGGENKLDAGGCL